jgi:hypothetical protein
LNRWPCARSNSSSLTLAQAERTDEPRDFSVVLSDLDVYFEGVDFKLPVSTPADTEPLILIQRPPAVLTPSMPPTWQVSARLGGGALIVGSSAASAAAATTAADASKMLSPKTPRSTGNSLVSRRPIAANGV